MKYYFNTFLTLPDYRTVNIFPELCIPIVSKNVQKIQEVKDTGVKMSDLQIFHVQPTGQRTVIDSNFCNLIGYRR